MITLAAIVSLLAAAPPGGEGLSPARSRPLLHLVQPPWAPVAGTPTAATPSGEVVAPPCSGDVCQPRVAVPGFEPRISMRGKRTELALALLDRARVEPLATMVWAMAATGLRLDYTPATFDQGLDAGRGGWGHLQVLLRWRVNAANRPVWPVRHR